MADPLRVCIDARVISGIPGGGEQFVIGLACGLSRLVDGDEEYYFLTYPGQDEWIRPYVGGRCAILSAASNLALLRVRERLELAYLALEGSPGGLLGDLIRQFPFLPSCASVIEQARVDVVHLTRQAGFLTKLPTIYHPHDLQHVHLPLNFSLTERWARERVYRALCRRAEAVAVASSWCKRDIVGHYGLPDEKVRVVSLAPVVSEYGEPKEADLHAARRTFALPESFLLYPAQTWPHKNHMGVLEAMAVLRDRHGLCPPLVCCGRLTRFYGTIERRIRELGLVEQVRFLGFVSPKDIQCLYRLSRSVVIPTKFEAGSFPLWEAFSLGVPAACSRVTSLPDQAGDAAIVFDAESPSQMAEAIRDLWTNDGMRVELAQRGKRRVSMFTWERTARSFRALYRLIGRRPLTAEDHELLESTPLT